MAFAVDKLNLDQIIKYAFERSVIVGGKPKRENASFFFKGGYLDFSHLTELKKMYIIEIYMKKQYKSSRIKNHEIKKKNR